MAIQDRAGLRLTTGAEPIYGIELAGRQRDGTRSAWGRLKWWCKMYSSDMRFFVIRTLAAVGLICLIAGVVFQAFGRAVPELLMAGFTFSLGHLTGVLTPSEDKGAKKE